MIIPTFFRVDAVVPVAVMIHGGVFVEADGFETFGCVAEFFVTGWEEGRMLEFVRIGDFGIWGLRRRDEG